MDYFKQFNNILTNLDYSRNMVTKFSDFLTLATYSLAQPFYNSEEIEEKYKSVAKNYNLDQLQQFAQLIATVTLALEEKHQDFLGQVFSMNDFGNSNKGQFFTPYHLSKMMAQMVNVDIKEIEKQLENYDYVTLSEPCCGSGGMIIAFAESMKESGYNYQHQLYVEAVDIDEICFKMAYIQLSLLGIPAKVIRGDSLSMRYYEVLYTPFYFLSGFRDKFEQKKKIEKLNVLPSHYEPKANNAAQLTLFDFL